MSESRRQSQSNDHFTTVYYQTQIHHRTRQQQARYDIKLYLFLN